MSESWNVCLNMIPGHNSVTNQVNFVKKEKDCFIINVFSWERGFGV